MFPVNIYAEMQKRKILFTVVIINYFSFLTLTIGLLENPQRLSIMQ